MAPDDDKTGTHVTLTNGTMVLHYRVIEKIGAGGMGEVYLAEDTELDRKVALKFLPPDLCRDPDCRARFKREAQAAAKLSHPNIVTIHEVAEYGNRPFIVMEYLQGKSLQEMIRSGHMPMGKAIDLAVQIGEGLDAAHRAGVIHRDVKPANIVVGDDGRARMLDFGLATIKGTERLTQTGSTVGTLGYMSPEQTRGEATDQRSDIFSFGVILYEMITGCLPFRGEHEAAILYAIAYEEPEPLARYKSGIPEGLQRIISKALAKDKGERYQHVDDLLSDLRRVIPRLVVFPEMQKQRLRLVVPSVAVVIVALLVLILKPWRFEFSPTQETEAAANWLAVMYFDNVADPNDSKRMGEIATNLLITGLSQSEYIKVVSSQRLYDLLKQMGKEGVKAIDRATASQVARKANARWMLTGSILQSEPRLVLTSQLVDVAGGGVIASQRVTGNPGEDIFAVIDRLTEDVKKCDALPAAFKAESPVRTGDVTTRSPEAYTYYLEGLEYFNKYYFDDGCRAMQKAIEYDSTFADAYGMLALMSFFGTWRKDEAIDQAMKYIDRTSDQSRRRIIYQYYFIKGDLDRAIAATREYLQYYPDDKRAWLMLAMIYRQGDTENYDSTIAFCNRALALDPNFRMAYNAMAYAYEWSDRHAEAVTAINRYIELAPNEANPYDSRGDLYGMSGQLDSALASYEKAIAIKPNFGESLKKKGFMEMFFGQYEQAENSFRTYFSGLDKPIRGYWRASLTYIPRYRGKFREALQVADECIAANKVDGMEYTNWVMYSLKSDAYDWLGRRDSALLMQQIASKLAAVEEDIQNKEDRQYWLTVLTYKAGDTSASRVMLDQLAQDAQSKRPHAVGTYWHAKGSIALFTTDYSKAVEYLARADSVFNTISGNYELAEAYLESRNHQQAIKMLEQELRIFDQYRAINGPEFVRGYYLLGRAYDEIGEKDKARAALETFLTIWKDADPGIKEVDDAKARLTRLKGKS